MIDPVRDGVLAGPRNVWIAGEVESRVEMARCEGMEFASIVFRPASMWSSLEKQPTGVSNKMHASHRLRQVRPYHLESSPDRRLRAGYGAPVNLGARHCGVCIGDVSNVSAACRNGPVAQTEERPVASSACSCAPKQSAFCGSKAALTGSLSRVRKVRITNLWNKARYKRCTQFCQKHERAFAHFGCRAKLLLAACRSLKRRETQPGGKVAALGKGLGRRR